MREVELSVVVPMFNEVEGLATLFTRLGGVLAGVSDAYEIVCVNDGSSDGTLAALLAERERNTRVCVVDLARNFGKDIALSAGLDYVRGRAVVPLDADLQDPPELIPELIAKWREGYDVVYAQRRSRQGETRFKLRTAGMFYRIINRLAEIRIPENTGDFRLMDRRVVDVLRGMPERARFMKGLFAWVGFRQVAVPFDRDPRQAGRTKWNYLRLWRFALDGITSFSSAPLKVWSYLGGGIALSAFLYAVFLIVRTMVFGVDVPGYASIMVAVLFLGGIQLLGIGVLGEYVGRIFEEVKRRPLYVARAVYEARGSDGA